MNSKCSGRKLTENTYALYVASAEYFMPKSDWSVMKVVYIRMPQGSLQF